MDKGLVLVNTGPGKGKTTAALGTVMRALGQGLKVAVLQFIKNRETGESRFLMEYGQAHPERLVYRRFGLGFVGDEPGPADRAKAAEALAATRGLLSAGYDLIVLDEICVALAKGLIETAEVLELIESRPRPVNLILTGRGCPAAIVDLADTVSQIQALKHAYQKGIPARRGIEY